MKGLELSALAVVSVKSGLALTLSADQTPSGFKDETSRLAFYRAAAAYYNWSTVVLTCSKRPNWVVDGFYAKEQAWDQVTELGMFMITARRPPSYVVMPT